jgi:hypothetical protein
LVRKELFSKYEGSIDVEAMVTSGTSEQRNSDRASVRRCGWFANVKGAQLRDCIVLDESRSGARLAIDNPNDLPDSFYIYMSLDFRSRYYCRVIWRSKNQIGVEYQDRNSETVANQK